MHRSVVKSRLMIVLGAILFGTTGTSQYFAPDGIDPAATGALRLAIGSPLLCLLALGLRPQSLKGTLSLPRIPLLFCVAGVTIYQLCFFKSVHLTGVAVGTLVAIGSAPIVAGIAGYVLLGEVIGLKWCLAAVLTLSGCALLVLPGGNITVDPTGVALAFAAGGGYALVLLASKRLLANRSPLVLMAVVLTIAALVLSPKLIVADWQLWLTPRGIGVALWLGIAATGLSYLLLASGLSGTPVSSAALLTLAEPLVACMLGIMVIGEDITVFSFAGMVFIFGGLILVGLQRVRAGTTSALDITH